MSALVAEQRAMRPTTPGPCPVIETMRLVLRPHRMTDATAIAASLGDFAVSRMLTRVPVPYDGEDARDWLNIATSGLRPDWHLAVTLDDVHVGVVSLELRHGLWHLGYWLNRFYWGKGLMGEAVELALERFFRRMPQVEIASGAFADNAASLRLLSRCGFRTTGMAQVYSISRTSTVPLVDMRLTQPDFTGRA